MKISELVSYINMAICIFLNVRLWWPPFCKLCHVTQIEKYQFTGFGLGFALKTVKVNYIVFKGTHLGHSLTLFCIN